MQSPSGPAFSRLAVLLLPVLSFCNRSVPWRPPVLSLPSGDEPRLSGQCLPVYMLQTVSACHSQYHNGLNRMSIELVFHHFVQCFINVLSVTLLVYTLTVYVEFSNFLLKRVSVARFCFFHIMLLLENKAYRLISIRSNAVLLIQL